MPDIETHKLLNSYQFAPIATAYIWPKDYFWVCLEEKKWEVIDPVRRYLGSKSPKIAEKLNFFANFYFSNPSSSLINR